MKRHPLISEACERVIMLWEADKENAVRVNTAWLQQRTREQVTFAWGRGALYMASAVLVVLMIVVAVR